MEISGGEPPPNSRAGDASLSTLHRDGGKHAMPSKDTINRRGMP